MPGLQATAALVRVKGAKPSGGGTGNGLNRHKVVIAVPLLRIQD